MILQMMFMHKSSLTDITSKRSFSRVPSHVTFKVVHMRKRLVAEWTHLESSPQPFSANAICNEQFLQLLKFLHTVLSPLKSFQSSGKTSIS